VSDSVWTLLVHSNLNARKGSIPLQLKRLEG
jgi:hypothetical protein